MTSDYPGRDPFKDPITADERRAILATPERWGARANGAPPRRMCAVWNRISGAHGLMVNHPDRPRWTVYEIGMFDRGAIDLLRSPGPIFGVEQHNYKNLDELWDAGWRPD